MQKTSYAQTQAILRALEFAAARGGFTSPDQKKTALALIKSMRSTKSVSGRHQQLTSMLKKGATIDEMKKATGASRRTIFRYLNHLKEAGLNVSPRGGTYTLS